MAKSKKKKERLVDWATKRKWNVKKHYDTHGIDLTAIAGHRIPIDVPDSSCKYCEPTHREQKVDEFFDEDGYPIGSRRTVAHKKWEDHWSEGNEEEAGDEDGELASNVFRFLDLPPELRNRVYELAFTKPEQPVCIPDHFLRPSQYDDLESTRDVLRNCSADLTCWPCQLHDIVDLPGKALTWVSQQLHRETALTPYMANTFSVHNVYYLQAFLELIGSDARQHLRSLRFVWRLPEEEAHGLGLYTATATAYRLLGECRALVELDVEMDLANLLTWDQSGRQRTQMRRYLHEVPNIERLYELRGLKDVKFGWRRLKGFEGMHEWVCWLIGVWRLPRGAHCANAFAVECELQQTADGRMEYVHWRADGDEADDEVANDAWS